MSDVPREQRPGDARASLAAAMLGRVPYLDGWRLQEAVATRVRDGGAECLLLLEHDPVYTIGRRGTLDHLLVDLADLRASGATVYRVDRGGDITYHGPGQLVGYPIIRLGDRPDLVRYVRGLEETLIEVLSADDRTVHTLLRPHSGKMHQLRVHLAALGLGILNDGFYPVLLPEAPDDFDRPLQLLARELRFVDPLSDQERVFTTRRRLALAPPAP